MAPFPGRLLSAVRYCDRAGPAPRKLLPPLTSRVMYVFIFCLILYVSRLLWHALCSGRQGRRRNVWVYLLSTGCLCLMLLTVRKLTRAMLSVVILYCCVPARCCDCLRVTYVSRRAVSVYCLKPSLQSTIWCERCLSLIHVAWCSLIMFAACARFINEYVCSLCSFHWCICLQLMHVSLLYMFL